MNGQGITSKAFSFFVDKSSAQHHVEKCKLLDCFDKNKTSRCKITQLLYTHINEGLKNEKSIKGKLVAVYSISVVVVSYFQFGCITWLCGSILCHLGSLKRSSLCAYPIGSLYLHTEHLQNTRSEGRSQN